MRVQGRVWENTSGPVLPHLHGLPGAMALFGHTTVPSSATEDANSHQTNVPNGHRPNRIGDGVGPVRLHTT